MKRYGTVDPKPRPKVPATDSNAADAFEITNVDQSDKVAAWCFRELWDAGGRKSVVAEHWITTQYWVDGDDGNQEISVKKSTLTLEGIVLRLKGSTSYPVDGLRYYHHDRPATP